MRIEIAVATFMQAVWNVEVYSQVHGNIITKKDAILKLDLILHRNVVFVENLLTKMRCCL
jgi:hypothetical protein